MIHPVSTLFKYRFNLYPHSFIILHQAPGQAYYTNNLLPPLSGRVVPPPLSMNRNRDNRPAWMAESSEPRQVGFHPNPNADLNPQDEKRKMSRLCFFSKYFG